MDSTPNNFRIGVESVLPSSEDWWATIYGCWFGKYFTEEQLAMALREVGAQFSLFYDSLAPKKTRRLPPHHRDVRPPRAAVPLQQHLRRHLRPLGARHRPRRVLE